VGKQGVRKEESTMKCGIHINENAIALRESWIIKGVDVPMCEICLNQFKEMGMEKFLNLRDIPEEYNETGNSSSG
jgi:hypothetical protein